MLGGQQGHVQESDRFWVDMSCLALSVRLNEDVCVVAGCLGCKSCLLRYLRVREKLDVVFPESLHFVHPGSGQVRYF